jgi:hypothetical protein
MPAHTPSPAAPSPGGDGELSVTVEGSETELVLVVAGDIDAGSHIDSATHCRPGSTDPPS